MCFELSHSPKEESEETLQLKSWVAILTKTPASCLSESKTAPLVCDQILWNPSLILVARPQMTSSMVRLGPARQNPPGNPMEIKGSQMYKGQTHMDDISRCHQALETNILQIPKTYQFGNIHRSYTETVQGCV
jgi:hypothetical protein